MKMLPLKLVALGILLCGAPLQAQENPNRDKLAEELLDLFEIEKSIDPMLNQIMAMQERMLDQQNIPPEAKELTRKFIQVNQEEIRALFVWDKIKPMFVSVYAENFSPEELQGLVEFFKSPIGQVWVKKQPDIQMATMQKMQVLMQDIQPKLQEAIMKAVEEAKKAAAEKKKNTPAES